MFYCHTLNYIVQAIVVGQKLELFEWSCEAAIFGTKSPIIKSGVIYAALAVHDSVIYSNEMAVNQENIESKSLVVVLYSRF